MNHFDIEELVAGYALDALDKPDQEQVEQHLGTCVKCQVAARSIRAVVEQLGFSAPIRQPPASVKALLMDRVAAEPRPQYSPLDTAVSRPGHLADLRGASRWLIAAAVVPWLAVVALGVSMLVTHGSTPANPLRVMTLNGPHGEVGRLAIVSGDRTALLTLTHLPALRHGQSLNCWLKHDGKMDHVNSFGLIPSSDDATTIIHAGRPLNDYSAVAVTVDASTHPSSPAGTVLATGSL